MCTGLTLFNLKNRNIILKYIEHQHLALTVVSLVHLFMYRLEIYYLLF